MKNAIRSPGRPRPGTAANGARPAPGRGRPAGPSGTGRTAGRLVSAGRRLLAVADALPVTVLAVIAGAGSFTHIRDTAAQHGQHGPMSWAVAVCIDLTCVMAARERQRDKQHGIATRRLSWPAVVLAGGVGLSLAANLAQAQPTAWGRVVAAVPSGAFLVAVSMIERRAARRAQPAHPAAAVLGQDDDASAPSGPGRPPSPPQDGQDEALLAQARRAAAEHQDQARPADHPRRAPRPPRRLQPGRLRPAAPAPHERTKPPAGSLTRCMTTEVGSNPAVQGGRQVPPLVFSAWDSATRNAATAVVNSGGNAPPARGPALPP